MAAPTKRDKSPLVEVLQFGEDPVGSAFGIERGGELLGVSRGFVVPVFVIAVPVEPGATSARGVLAGQPAGAGAPVEKWGPQNQGCVRVRVRTGAGDPWVRCNRALRVRVWVRGRAA